MFIPAQVDELKKHYLSKNLYLNFPTIAEDEDIVDLRWSHKIDIGSSEILNLGKLYSAHKFLGRRYQVYNQETGEIFLNPSFNLLSQSNIQVKQKSISSRMKITKVDELMKPIFDDFLGLAENSKVREILSLVDAEDLALLLAAKRAGKNISREEMVTAMTIAQHKLGEYVEKIYQEKISPLVFYIGSTGLLPDEITAKIMTAEEIAAKYSDLQFSKHEQEGTFFEVGNSIISIYAQVEGYSKKIPVAIEA
jgi:hypothetical protein